MTCVVNGVLPGVQLLTALECCQVCSMMVVNGIGMLPGVQLLTALGYCHGGQPLTELGCCEVCSC